MNLIEYAFLVNDKTNFKKLGNYKKITRIYVGDQECDHNFISILRNKKILNYLFKTNKNITFLLPRFINKNLDIFINFLKHNSLFLNKKEGIEFVINDYFIIYGIQKIIKKGDYIIGAYINNQIRDNQTNIKSFIRGDYNNYNNFYNNINIKSLDLFNTKNEIIINNLDLDLNIFFPYIVHGFSRYCYSYHINNNKKYLEPVEKCDGCKGNNFLLKGKSGKDILYYKNNKYLTSNFNLNNFFDKKNNVSRIIYNYDLL